MDFEKIVIITRKTWLEGLIEKFNTKSQAKFYIEHMGGNFQEYEDSHVQYYKSLEILKQQIPEKYKFQIVERRFLPNFLFNPSDLVVVIGPDGLVVNAAKYLENQRIIAINPDSTRIDGVFTIFHPKEFTEQLKEIEKDEEHTIGITMAKAELNSNQSLYAVNDLFIGHKSHQSARYTISYKDQSERHSSSGLIVSTGAGSTGWFKSVVFGAVGISTLVQSMQLSEPRTSDFKFQWDSPYICYSVREPWKSGVTSAKMIYGKLFHPDTLRLESNMPENGVIFSDGIEKDYLEFNTGTIANIKIAEKKTHLIIREPESEPEPEFTDYERYR